MLFGERIRLRAIEREDLSALFRWWNDPELWGLLGSRRRVSGSEELEAWFDGELDKSSPQEGRTFALDDEEGNFLGTVWYGAYEAGDRQALVGLYIGLENKRSLGYGTDALATLLTYLFEELGLHKARLLVQVDNAHAIAVYRKLGFLEEGVLREHRFYGGKFHDFRTMGLLDREFKQMSNSPEA